MNSAGSQVVDPNVAQRKLPNQLLIASATVAVIAAVVSLRGAWELPGDRYLIVHADDAGMCASVNRATIDAMENGVVSSASIMVPCSAFEEFAEYARAHPEKDFGVHLTLFSDWDDVRWGPVTGAANVPSLVEADGNFYRSIASFREKAIVDEVEQELRAQVRRALDRGIRVSHLDCHKNSLIWRPDLIELYVRLGQEFNVPIRFCKSFPQEWINDLPADCIAAYHEQLKVLYTRQSALADVVDTENYDVPPDRKRSYFVDFLRKLKPGVSVVVVHCCDVKGGDWSPSDAVRRQGDFQVFRSAEMAAEMRALGVRLIDWEGFQRRTDQSTEYEGR